MKTPAYNELYELLVEATGTTPGLKLANDLAALYTRHPATYAAKVRDVTAGWQAGRITSPWAFLRSEMRRVDEVRAAPEGETTERQQAIRLAETYIRNAGLYEPSEKSLEEGLFGPGGRLQPWANDDQLRRRMTDLWHQEQPRAQQAQAEALERAEAWKRQHEPATDDLDWSTP